MASSAPVQGQNQQPVPPTSTTGTDNNNSTPAPTGTSTTSSVSSANQNTPATEPSRGFFGNVWYYTGGALIRGITWIAKTLVWAITCGNCCKDEASPEDVSKAFTTAKEAYSNAKTDDEKKKAFNDVFKAHPHVQTALKDADVKAATDGKEGEAKTKAKTDAEKKFGEDFAKCELAMLQRGVDYASKKAEEAKNAA